MLSGARLLMRPFYWVILVVVQIWFACQVSFVPFDAARVSYRRDERAAALKAQNGNPSPATRSAVQEELRLAGRHVVRRQLAQASALLAVFLALDIAFMSAWTHSKRESVSA